MRLHESVKQFYIDNLHKLPLDKQFHFASRIASWYGEDWAKDKLQELKPWMLGEYDGGLNNVITQLINSEPKSSINAYQLRKPYLEKYSPLYGIHSALFRIRHLLTIYANNAVKDLNEVISKSKIDDLIETLQRDDAAIKNLSTYAINSFYLYKHILLGQKDFVDLDHIQQIGQSYERSDKQQLQLLIYLFTHCIIGETNFYTHKILPQRLSKCLKMLDILESLISATYDEINLDNKLEFLVCCRICEMDSNLFDRIFAECRASISNNGQFLVDTLNKNAQTDKATFEKAEHRNVLFIMSSSDYTPQPMELPHK